MLEWTPGLTKIKDADAILNYKFRWADWLEGGAIIQSALITVDSGITVEGYNVVDTDTAVAVQISGGTAGLIYDVTCRVTADDGQIDDRTIKLSIREL